VTTATLLADCIRRKLATNAFARKVKH